LPFNLFPS